MAQARVVRRRAAVDDSPSLDTGGGARRLSRVCSDAAPATDGAQAVLEPLEALLDAFFLDWARVLLTEALEPARGPPGVR